MNYEVENKYPVRDLSGMIDRLQQLGAQFRDTVDQTDLYFAHPVRDFAKTDEALRIRRVGSVNCVTYKGPRIDETTKTRKELEVRLVDGVDHFAQYVQLLEVLGFRRVAEVSKRRQLGTYRQGETDVELALDDVRKVGTFIELEIVAAVEQLNAAQDTLKQLAKELGLAEPERRSYLELLLERQGLDEEVTHE